MEMIAKPKIQISYAKIAMILVGLVLFFLMGFLIVKKNKNKALLYDVDILGRLNPRSSLTELIYLSGCKISKNIKTDKYYYVIGIPYSGLFLYVEREPDSIPKKLDKDNRSVYFLDITFTAQDDQSKFKIDVEVMERLLDAAKSQKKRASLDFFIAQSDTVNDYVHILTWKNFRSDFAKLNLRFFDIYVKYKNFHHSI